MILAAPTNPFITALEQLGPHDHLPNDGPGATFQFTLLKHP
jgi:hypothetical protein